VKVVDTLFSPNTASECRHTMKGTETLKKKNLTSNKHVNKMPRSGFELWKSVSASVWVTSLYASLNFI